MHAFPGLFVIPSPFPITFKITFMKVLMLLAETALASKCGGEEFENKLKATIRSVKDRSP